ncbi:MAG: CidA/LrgA family protein [Lachnospiraceae bacterium]|nr:CidA/LrgA family protein [Lachnospiraceae bacterium]
MKHVKGIIWIFGITMTGELLNHIIPLPVPAGVYGLFILLGLLISGILKLSDVAPAGELLLDLMPLMFIPAAVGLIEKTTELRAVLVPFAVITIATTLFVMAVTAKTAELVLHHKNREEP